MSGPKTDAARRRMRIVRVLLHEGRTGAQLAEVCGVALRTIYRDVRVLRAEGLPIEGTVGGGYRLQGDLEALPLTPREALQIVIQLRAVSPTYSGHARIEAAMPATLLAVVDAMRKPRIAHQLSLSRDAAESLIGADAAESLIGALAARTLAGGPR